MHVVLLFTVFFKASLRRYHLFLTPQAVCLIPWTVFLIPQAVLSLIPQAVSLIPQAISLILAPVTAGKVGSLSKVVVSFQRVCSQLQLFRPTQPVLVDSKLQLTQPPGHRWLCKQPQILGSSESVLASLSCAELGTAQPQLLVVVIPGKSKVNSLSQA